MSAAPMRRSPFPPRPSATDRAQTILALAGMAVLGIVLLSGPGLGRHEPTASGQLEGVLQEDRFGPPQGGRAGPHFYEPSDALDDLRQLEVSLAGLRARLTELASTTSDNIQRPVTELVTSRDEPEVP